MAGLLSKFSSGSPETVARRKFGLWSIGVFILLLPVWWLWGADILISMIKPLAGLFFKLFGLTGEITVQANGDWIIGTKLTRAGVPVDYTMTHMSLRRVALCIPMALAFMTAPPRVERPIRALAVSAVVLTLVYLLSLATVIWGDLAAQLNPGLATVRHQADAALDQPALHPILSQIAIVGRYIAMSIAPLITAVLLWASLNPKGRALLMEDTTLRDEN